MNRGLIPYYLSRAFLSALFGYLVSTSAGLVTGVVLGGLTFLGFLVVRTQWPVSDRRQHAPLSAQARRPRKRDTRPGGSHLSDGRRAFLPRPYHSGAPSLDRPLTRLAGDCAGCRLLLPRQQLAVPQTVAAPFMGASTQVEDLRLPNHILVHATVAAPFMGASTQVEDLWLPNLILAHATVAAPVTAASTQVEDLRLQDHILVHATVAAPFMGASTQA